MRQRSLARSLAPLALAAAVMLPRLASPQFGLLDDGLTLQTGGEVAGRWSSVLSLIPETGRFFPAYWLVYSAVFAVVGARPLAFYAVNLVLLAALCAILMRLVRWSGGTSLQAAVAAVVLAVSGPAVETFYTLSKAESLQMTWIGLSLVACAASATSARRARRVGLGALATAAAFLAFATKETTAVLIPVSLGWLAVERWSPSSPTWARFTWTCVAASLAAAAAFAALRWHHAPLALAEGTYTRAYALDAATAGPAAFRIAAWLLRDFAFLLPLLALAVAALVRGAAARRPILYAGVWMAGWLAVYVPWPATFEYYLLPFAFGAAVLAGTLVGETWSRCRSAPSRARPGAARAALAATALLWTATTVNAAADARAQLTVDRANTELVAFLGGVPPGSRVVLNMAPVNEYHFELPMHLAELQGRPDLQVEPVPPSGPVASVGTDVFVVTPEVANQPRPSVRIAGDEAGVRADNARLGELLAGGAELVYQTAQHAPLVELGLHRLLCPLAVSPIRDVTYCPGDRGLIDRRTFSYGWRVHRVGPT